MQQTSLFILASLAERGAMHGHQLRRQAAEDHAQEWADVSPGSIYGSLTRLGGQGLVSVVRTEQEGGRPARQVYDITAEGRRALGTMVHDALVAVAEVSDPFDLAFAHAHDWSDAALCGIATARLAVLEGKLAQLGAHQAAAAEWLAPREALVIDHQRARLAAEVDWHRHLLARLQSATPASLEAARPVTTTPFHTLDEVHR